MNPEINEILQENAQLEQELLLLQHEISGQDWCDICLLDLKARHLRRQEELRSLIYYAKQTIANK